LIISPNGFEHRQPKMCGTNKHGTFHLTPSFISDLFVSVVEPRDPLHQKLKPVGSERSPETVAKVATNPNYDLAVAIS
jgi:hypothetical protein